MKEIKAYVRSQRLEDIVSRLEEAGVRDLTVIRVDAFAALADSGANQLRIVRKYAEKYSAVAKLEIVCRDDEVGRFVAIIREHGKHGLSGGEMTPRHQGGRCGRGHRVRHKRRRAAAAWFPAGCTRSASRRAGFVRGTHRRHAATPPTGQASGEGPLDALPRSGMISREGAQQVAGSRALKGSITDAHCDLHGRKGANRGATCQAAR